jgi:serine/threonine protein kinase
MQQKSEQNLKVIASGGYGSVSSTVREDTLALKEMKCDTMNRTVSSILEYSIMKSINHPGVIQVTSLNVQDNEVSYTMALGNQTSRAISSDPRIILRWLRQIAVTLHYIHNLGIIHGDVKIDNTIIDSNGDIKLIDFGLSRPLGWQLPEHTYTYTHRAPEVWMGERFNDRADVWSFGCMVFEFFGKSLIDHHNITPATAKDSCLQQMKSIDDRLTRIPTNDQFKFIVRSCLNLNPNMRPSMQQVSQWLGAPDITSLSSRISIITQMNRTRYEYEIINLSLDILMKLLYSYEFSRDTMANVVNVSMMLITGKTGIDHSMIESGRILKYLQGYISWGHQYQLIDQSK